MLSRALWRILGWVAVIAVSFSAGYLAHRNNLAPLWLREIVFGYAETPSAGQELADQTTAVPQQDDAAQQRGLWGFHRPPPSVEQAAMAADTAEQLNALGYAGAVTEAPGSEGVIQHDEAQAHQGLNLYASGHAAEAFLMDMDGRVLHQWAYPFSKAWPNRRVDAWKDHWGHVYLYENGDLLAVYERGGIIKLDKDSNIEWKNPVLAHHDLFVREDGDIYVLTQQDRMNSRISDTNAVQEDFITVLSPEGGILREISLLECFENSEYASVLNYIKPWGDIFHTNTLNLVQHDTPYFEAGTVLVSVRELDTVAAIDLEREEVVWSISNMWVKQHNPVLSSGYVMLVFDNLGNRGYSRVVEFDLATLTNLWTYGEQPGEELFTYSHGAAVELPNGNILITESDNGRAFELTRDREIVWEFVSPHRGGENDDLIGIIPEMVRLPEDFSHKWADGVQP